ncbi:MAG: DUF3322 domain-containing protein [Rhodanobacteraceae bacterium]
MTWTTATDVRARLQRLWSRGDLLRDGAAGTTRFPLRLPLKGPNSADITERLGEVRTWVSGLASVSVLRLEWRDVHHRVQGLQRIPSAVWIDTSDDAIKWPGKRRPWGEFQRLLEATRQRNPALLGWLARRPLRALELADDWERLLAIVDWIAAHPRPGIYLRQVDVPGVHTKFVEAHRAELAEMLDLALPACHIDTTAVGASRFAARYGFREKPVRIRCRILDPAITLIPGVPSPDLTLDAASFSRLAIHPTHVLITENEINFLALPTAPDTIAIFGAGYGWDALAQALWLEHCAIHYWGDVDTHGFAILDQLRGHFDHVASLLMDRATLTAHEPFWGHEDRPTRNDLPRLTAAEQALYDDLRDNRIRDGLRLEQERLGYGLGVRAHRSGAAAKLIRAEALLPQPGAGPHIAPWPIRVCQRGVSC